VPDNVGGQALMTADAAKKPTICCQSSADTRIWSYHNAQMAARSAVASFLDLLARSCSPSIDQRESVMSMAIASELPDSLNLALSVLENESDFSPAHIVYVDSFLQVLCSRSRLSWAEDGVFLRLLAIHKRLLLAPESNQRAKLFAKILRSASAWLPDGSPARRQLCGEAIAYLSQNTVDSLRIGIALARIYFAPSRPDHPPVADAVHSALLLSISANSVRDPAFWPLLRKLFKFWRSFTLHFYVPYAREEEAFILGAAIALIEQAQAASTLITDQALLRMIYSAAKCAREIARRTHPTAWPGHELYVESYSRLLQHAISHFFFAALAMPTVVPNLDDRLAIGSVLLDGIITHFPASSFVDLVPQAVSIAVFHTSVTALERKEMDDSPMNFWASGFGGSGLRGKAVALWDRLWVAGVGLDALGVLALYAAVPMCEVLPLLLATGDRLLGDASEAAAHAAEMAVQMLSHFLDIGLQGLELLWWLLAAASFANFLPDEERSRLLSKSFALLRTRSVTEFTTGVGIVRRLAERGAAIPAEHVMLILEYCECCASLDAISLITMIGDRDPALTALMMARLFEAINSDLADLYTTRWRLSESCVALVPLIRASAADPPLEAMRRLLQMICQPELDAQDTILNLKAPLIEIMRIVPGVQLINELANAMLEDPGDWEFLLDDVAAVFLAFVCLHPESVPEVVVKEFMGADVIFRAIAQCLAPPVSVTVTIVGMPSTAKKKVCDIENMIAVTALLAALVQSGNVGEWPLGEEILRILPKMAIADGEEEEPFRFLCVVHVLASFLMVGNAPIEREVALRWMAMIEEGAFRTRYLRALCALTLPRVAAFWPDLPVMELRQSVVANTILENTALTNNEYYQRMLVSCELVVMPAEHRIPEIEGFVLEASEIGQSNA
jgi:hypothetical protein